MHVTFVLLSAVLLASACSAAAKSGPQPQGQPVGARAVRETITVRDHALERRVGELELRLLEKEAQVEDLQARLEDARGEVVRTMAKVQTVASRAEAASGMAEAEIALQSLKSSLGQQAPEVAQVATLVRQSSVEFNKQNYGGALYLAGQAKALAAASRGPLGTGSAGALRAGERAFAAPIRLRASARGNVREGPGTSFGIAFAVDAGALLTGHSYLDDWVRVTGENGRSGWIFRSLVTRR